MPTVEILQPQEPAPDPPRYTPEDYLRQEERGDFRSEFRDGEIVPMTGGSDLHNCIIVNLCAILRHALRGTECRVRASDLRLWMPQYRQYTYPDVMIICGATAFQQQRTDTVLNPTVIMEVLSKSTQEYDRSTKFKYYRSIPEFQEYLLINQYECSVEHFAKTEEGWLLRDYQHLDDRIELRSLSVALAMREIYEDVSFEPTLPESTGT